MAILSKTFAEFFAGIGLMRIGLEGIADVKNEEVEIFPITTN
jgi:hypothetical protein